MLEKIKPYHFNDFQHKTGKQTGRPVTLVFLLSAIVVLFWADVAIGVTNPGYRGLSYSERPVVNIGTFDGIRVNSLNGNLTLRRLLFTVSAKSVPVRFYLIYNSDHRLISSPFGRGWSLSYNIRYTKDSSGNRTLAWGDGRQDTFTWNGSAFIPPAGLYMTLTEPSTGKLLLTTKYGIKFYFGDSTHQKLTSIEDPNGKALNFAYDAAYRLITVTDGGGRTYNLGYNPSGKFISLTDPNLAGRSYIFSNDTAGRLTGITDPLGKTESFSYDAKNLITGITDRRGNTTTISYITPVWDADTRLVQNVSKGGSTTTFAFDNTLRTTTVSDPNGNSWMYAYDLSGHITTVTDPAAKTVSFTWDGNKNLLTTTDRSGNTTAFTYDANGNPLTVTDALGKIETRTYDPTFSRVTGLTDRNGNKWTFTYDSAGNRTVVTDPLGNPTTFTYDAMGQPITRTNPLLQTKQYGYNTNGNLTTVTDPLLAVTTFTYDSAGRLTKLTDPNGNTRQFAYDTIDRLISASDGLDNSTQYAYDNNNNTVKVTDRNGGVRGLTYDPLDRVTSVNDPLGKPETYTYDPAGNRLTTKGRNGNITSFAYNSLNRMTTKTLPLSRVYQFTYDANGNLISRVDPKGQTVSYIYSDLNRRVQRTVPGPVVTSYTYDPNGNRLQASNSSSTISMTYDTLNRLVTMTDAELSKTLTLGFDKPGQKITATNPEGDIQTYTYDGAGRPTRIVAGGDNFDYAYDPGGRRTSLTRPGSLTTNYAYDKADRITSISTALAGTPVQSFNYGYDPAGNTMKETRLDATTSSMTYDARNALIRETRTGSPAYDINYTLDARRNILNATGTPFFPSSPSTFTYNTANQIVQETGMGFSGVFTRDYTYDANGNLTQKLGKGDTTVDYAYDPLNRIISATDSSYGKENYAYDALDRLASIVVPAPEPEEPGTQRFFYDERGNIIASYDEKGQLVEQFWHNDITKAQWDDLRRLYAINPDFAKYKFFMVLLRPEQRNIFYILGQYLRSQQNGDTAALLVTDGHGNMALKSQSGIETQFYDTLGRIVNYASGWFFGTGGHYPNLNRFNGIIGLTGYLYDIWTNFMRNQPWATGDGTSYDSRDFREGACDQWYEHGIAGCSQGSKVPGVLGSGVLGPFSRMGTISGSDPFWIADAWRYQAWKCLDLYKTEIDAVAFVIGGRTVIEGTRGWGIRDGETWDGCNDYTKQNSGKRRR